MNDARSGQIFSPGDLLNNTYRIEAILGRGGTSEVYRARSELSGRVMAICLHPFVIGVSHRIWVLESALDYIMGHDHVWFATGEEIVDAWLKSGATF